MNGDTARPFVFVVVLNWNSPALTSQCLASLRKATYPNVQIVVVDNGSVDGSIDDLGRAFPEAAFIRNETNRGFCGANNQGIRFSLEKGADYVLLLNNDTIVDPLFLDPLVEALEADPRFGAACPKIYFEVKPTVIWSTGVNIHLGKWRRFFRGGRGGNMASLVFEMRGYGMEDCGQFAKQERVSAATGCALLMRRAALEKVGLLDERFFLIHEDSDWCMRAADSGYGVVFVPQSLVWHKVSASIVPKSPLSVYYTTRNTLLIIRKYADPLAKTVFYALAAGVVLRDGLRYLVGGRHAELSLFKIQGVVDFLRSRYGFRPNLPNETSSGGPGAPGGAGDSAPGCRGGV